MLEILESGGSSILGHRFIQSDLNALSIIAELQASGTKNRLGRQTERALSFWKDKLLSSRGDSNRGC